MIRVSFLPWALPGSTPHALFDDTHVYGQQRLFRDTSSIAKYPGSTKSPATIAFQPLQPEESGTDGEETSNLIVNSLKAVAFFRLSTLFTEQSVFINF